MQIMTLAVIYPTTNVDAWIDMQEPVISSFQMITMRSVGFVFDENRIAIRQGCSKGDIVFLKVHSDAMKERVIQGGVHTTSCEHISGKGARFHRVESILFKRSAFFSASEIIVSQSSIWKNI